MSENKFEQQLAVVGINYKTSPLEIRQNYQINRKEIPDSLKKIYESDGIEGAVIISTCNRIEFYLALNKSVNPLDTVKRHYCENCGIDIGKHLGSFYILYGKEAVNHLFRVISGIESLVFGEYQIQGQIKEAYSTACDCKTVEKSLHKLFHAAFRTGKKVRSQTSIGEGKQSVSGIASQIFLDNVSKDSRICIIGANENTRIFAGALKDAGYSNFIFVNRTIFKAQTLANDFGGRALPLDSVYEALLESDAVYSSTGAPGYVVRYSLLDLLISQGRCPSLIIDAAVPRDVETSNLPSHISVWDMQRLQNWLEAQESKRLAEIPEAEQIITSETNVFQAWSETLNNPMLNPYSEKFEIIRQQLMQENKPFFSESGYEDLDRITRSLVHRLQSTFVRMLVKNQEPV